MGIEGGHAIEDSLRLLRDYYALGVRYMTLTHFNTNNWADSQGDFDDPKVKHHNGLTPFGKDVVREMNRLGMMVDISHTADKTFYDALEVSTAPIIASHSSMSRRLQPHPQSDRRHDPRARREGWHHADQLRLRLPLAALSRTPPSRSWPRCAHAYRRPGRSRTRSRAPPPSTSLKRSPPPKLPPATLDDVVAQIDHAVKIGGIDHVGIGTDFDGVGCVPSGARAPTTSSPPSPAPCSKKVTLPTDIKKIYGGNLLRVMRAVEQRARELKSTPPIETKIGK